MKKIIYLYNYFLYRLNAVNEHGVHSPFVFDLLMNVIYNKNEYYPFKKIGQIRDQLIMSERPVNITGADWKANLNAPVASAKYAQLLFRLVNYFQPSHIIELGSSFGISAAYMASANSKNSVITIEKNQDVAQVAEQNFKKLKLKNIELKVGNSMVVLKTILPGAQNSAFICFSEELSKKGTVACFNMCLEKVDEESVFVFTNMYRSSETKEAWFEIKNNNKVTVTLDLFYLSLVFFRKAQMKQHFVIRF